MNEVQKRYIPKHAGYTKHWPKLSIIIG